MNKSLMIKNELANVITLIEHNKFFDKEQYIFDCGNGFGASVVQGMFTYGGNEGKWELAVIKFNNDETFDIHYNNKVANGDVIGYLEADEVMNLLEEISKFT